MMYCTSFRYVGSYNDGSALCHGIECYYGHNLDGAEGKRDWGEGESGGKMKHRSTDTEYNLSETKEQQATCVYPCSCPMIDASTCLSGVSLIKDGCGCCYVCARQQGDLCDYRHRCDESKGLYCDLHPESKVRGICRARSARPCVVDGETYKDGEEFAPDCRRLCSCQNGRYACTSLCVHEENTPSRMHCTRARLVPIEGQCCQQWVCQEKHDYSHSHVGLPITTLAGSNCMVESTPWSVCSVTCGMGVSTRDTNDNDDCVHHTQTRLCIVRPCGLTDQHMRGRECRSTWRSHSVRLRDSTCISASEYRPKYCSTCKRNKCCEPGITRTISVEFHCPINNDNSNEVDHMTSHTRNSSTLSTEVDTRNNSYQISKLFMWIQSCDCHVTDSCSYT